MTLVKRLDIFQEFLLPVFPLNARLRHCYSVKKESFGSCRAKKYLRDVSGALPTMRSYLWGSGLLASPSPVTCVRRGVQLPCTCCRDVLPEGCTLRRRHCHPGRSAVAVPGGPWAWSFLTDLKFKLILHQGGKVWFLECDRGPQLARCQCFS